MTSHGKIVAPLMVLVLGLALLLLLASSTPAAAAGAVSAATAKAAAQKLIGNVSVSEGKPGGMRGWKTARAGEPLLVYSFEGAPSEYLVPVLDSSGRTISTIGLGAQKADWHWYSDYPLAKFPLVSAGEAASKVRTYMKGRGLSASVLPAPQARIAPDNVVYWFFQPAGSQAHQMYAPAFIKENASSDLGTRPWDARMKGANPAVTPAAIEAAGAGLTAAPTAQAAKASAPSSGGTPSEWDIAGVPYHEQTTDWWCGPASLEMDFDYFGPDIDQGEIASVADHGQSYGVYNNELARAAQFSSSSTSVQDSSLRGYTARSLGYAMAQTTWEDGSALYSRRYSDLKALVSQNIPVLVLTYYWNPPSSGHFRLVKGYSDARNVFIVHDPWYSGAPHGPDVNFNQTQFVDTLWTYSHRWGMIATPWQVSVYKPNSIGAGQQFTVRADVTYPGPSPLGGEYPVASANATVTYDPAAFQVVGAGTKSLPSIDYTGSTGSASFTLKSLRSQSTASVNVTAQGTVGGNTPKYNNYSDSIGGVGTVAAPHPTSRVWGHDSIGVSSPSKTWYLAEGCTDGGFETWVLVQNPDPSQTAHVNLDFMTSKGQVKGPAVDLGPNSRTTFNVSQWVPSEYNVSTMVTSNVGVVAERSVYARQRTVGTDSIGASEPANQWYLAEGCTNGGFETWVLVQNPNAAPAHVSLTYMTDTGPVKGPSAVVPASSRMTFNVADTVPGRWSVSTEVASDKPVVAERSEYWANRTADGHDSIGVSAPSKAWYLAEGCTNGGFETWLLVQNPNPTPASVTLTYMTDLGSVPGPTATIPANSRKTFNVADYVPNTWSVSTQVTSAQAVIAERSMYGNNRQWGTDSIGAAAPANTWYLAEGCTNTGFESWVLVQNPNSAPTSVTLTYMTPAGPVDGPSVSLPAHSRQTFNVADTVPWEWEVSTKVVATAPVIAERAMYGDSNK